MVREMLNVNMYVFKRKKNMTRDKEKYYTRQTGKTVEVRTYVRRVCIGIISHAKKKEIYTKKNIYSLKCLNFSWVQFILQMYFIQILPNRPIPTEAGFVLKTYIHKKWTFSLASPWPKTDLYSCDAADREKLRRRCLASSDKRRRQPIKVSTSSSTNIQKLESQQHEVPHRRRALRYCQCKISKMSSSRFLDL